MLILKLIIIVLLLLIFIQDLKRRSVYWILFPALAVLYVIILRMERLNYIETSISAFSNLGFLAVQFLLVTIYFTMKNKKFTNITIELLGLGDVLFLVSAALYPSMLNYIFFYIISLIGSLITWLIWQTAVRKKSKQIPLAGLQSLMFAFFLIMDWFFNLFDLTNDNWLLALVTR